MAHLYYVSVRRSHLPLWIMQCQCCERIMCVVILQHYWFVWVEEPQCKVTSMELLSKDLYTLQSKCGTYVWTCASTRVDAYHRHVVLCIWHQALQCSTCTQGVDCGDDTTTPPLICHTVVHYWLVKHGHGGCPSHLSRVTSSHSS